MDNLHARMNMPEHEQSEPERVAKATESHRYVSPRPAASAPKEAAKPVKWLALLVAAIVVAGIVFGAWKLLFGGASADGIDHSKYQAVFMVNGSSSVSVYFGKLERMGDGYYKLTSVYFLPADQTADKITQDNAIKLSKMTAQIHSPEDALIIPREQIQSYQNMKDDSKISAYIKQDTTK